MNIILDEVVASGLLSLPPIMEPLPYKGTGAYTIGIPLLSAYHTWSKAYILCVGAMWKKRAPDFPGTPI